MAGYFGTDKQQDLQRRNHKLEDWIGETRGLYNAGRLIGCEDVERVAFGTLKDIFDRDGVLAFRLIPHEILVPVVERFEALGARTDHWNVYLGTAQQALNAVSAILDDDGDTGLRVHRADADDKLTRDIQAFSAENGVAPFPGYLLARQAPQAITLVQRTDNGEILALGHAYFPHNQHSPFSRHAWVGMISVSSRARGFGLGRHMNAALIQAAIKDLNATHITQMAASDNFASGRMITACGIGFRPDLGCCVVSQSEVTRITR